MSKSAYAIMREIDLEYDLNREKEVEIALRLLKRIQVYADHDVIQKTITLLGDMLEDEL
jgi:hypothetical protein